jgi:hypothetical protein
VGHLPGFGAPFEGGGMLKNTVYMVLMPAEAVDQILAIYRQHAVTARSLSEENFTAPDHCEAWAVCKAASSDLSNLLSLFLSNLSRGK